MRAAGDATKPSYLMTFSAVIQIVLGPLFIFGMGAWDDHAGAAWAFWWRAFLFVMSSASCVKMAY